MSLRRTLAAVALAATLAPLAHADTPASPLDSLPPDVRRIVDGALAKQAAAARATPKEELPSLDQLRVWYSIQKEKLGETNEEVKNIAAMIKALSPPTFSVDFPGGTVAEYLDAIRKAYPQANIVGAQGLETVTLPPIALSEVTLAGALKPLEMVARNADGRAANLNFALQDGVASVSIPDRSLPDPPKTMVWNVTEITTGGYVSVADITAGVETALSVFPGAQPETRFHEGTGIFAVRASNDHLLAIERVLGELMQAAERAKRLQGWVFEARSSIANGEADVAALERRLIVNEKVLEEAAEGDIGINLFNARQGVLETQANLDKARVALNEARARLAALEADAKAQPSNR